MMMMTSAREHAIIVCASVRVGKKNSVKLPPPLICQPIKRLNGKTTKLKGNWKGETLFLNQIAHETKLLKRGALFSPHSREQLLYHTNIDYPAS